MRVLGFWLDAQRISNFVRLASRIIACSQGKSKSSILSHFVLLRFVLNAISFCFHPYIKVSATVMDDAGKAAKR